MDAVEHELRATLADAADNVPVPRCDPQRLTAEGRRAAHASRLHTVWWGVASVAAALAAVAGSVAIVRSTDDGAPPQPADHSPTSPPTTAPTKPPERLKLADLPNGAPPAIPHWIDDVLHVGEQGLLIRPRLAFTAGGRTLFMTGSAANGYEIELLRGLHPTALGPASGHPVIRPDGRFAAWETGGSGHLATIQLWDLETGTMVGSRRFRSQAHCCDAPSLPLGIDALGRVYIDDGGRPLVWDHSSDVLQAVTGIGPEDLVGAWPGGAVVRVTHTGGKSEPGRSRYGTVDAAGRFHSTATYPSQFGKWSPSGSSVAFDTPYGSLALYDVETRKIVRVPLTGGWHVNFAWETENSLMLWGVTGGHHRHYWLRYDVDMRIFEIAAVFGARVEVAVPESG